MLQVLRRRRTRNAYVLTPGFTTGGQHALPYSEQAEWEATIRFPRHRDSSTLLPSEVAWWV